MIAAYNQTLRLILIVRHKNLYYVVIGTVPILCFERSMIYFKFNVK